MKTTLTIFDIFGVPVRFYLNGKSTYKTYWGGGLSIVIAIFTLFYFVF